MIDNVPEHRLLEQVEPLKPPLQPLNIKPSGLHSVGFILFIVFGFAAAAGAFVFLNKGTPKPQAAVKIQKPVVVGEVEVIPLKATETVSAPVSKKPLPTLTLSGILFGKDGSLALINGRIVREGSTIDGAKLEKVLTDKVELSFEGNTIILRAR